MLNHFCRFPAFLFNNICTADYNGSTFPSVSECRMEKYFVELQLLGQNSIFQMLKTHFQSLWAQMKEFAKWHNIGLSIDGNMKMYYIYLNKKPNPDGSVCETFSLVKEISVGDIHFDELRRWNMEAKERKKKKLNRNGDEILSLDWSKSIESKVYPEKSAGVKDMNNTSVTFYEFNWNCFGSNAVCLTLKLNLFQLNCIFFFPIEIGIYDTRAESCNSDHGWKK